MSQPPLSPGNSPRLPSPPPFPEVQIGPKSPSPGAGGESAVQEMESASSFEEGQRRRIRPGTKAVDMAASPELVPLHELDSSFQLQEYLRTLYLHKTRSADNESTVRPITRELAEELAKAPDGVDRALWLYELCRLLVQRANALIVGFFADAPPCSAANCPEMRASEWQYLCAVHDPPKSCCAIDYCCHTLDWAANTLTSQTHFPSRLSLGSEAPGSSQASVRQLTNIFRRVYRMFAHAWFQHRDVFWALESQEGLYIFYKTVCDVYRLMPDESYTVPPEAEGAAPSESMSVKIDTDHLGDALDDDNDDRGDGVGDGDGPYSGSESPEKEGSPTDGAAPTTLSTGASARRHKQTPSTGSFVTTIAEGDEDGESSPEAPSLLSTVRRDRSNSPSKRSPIVDSNVPIVQIGGRLISGGEALSDKVREMSLQDKVTDEASASSAEPKVEEAPLVADLET